MAVVSRVNHHSKSPTTRSIILRSIYENKGVASADVARILGMGPVIVKHHVDQLLKDGKIIKAKPTKNGQGRPPAVLKLNAQNGYIVGVDMDPAMITSIVVDKSGTVIASHEYPLQPTWSSDKIVEALIYAGQDIIRLSNVPRRKVEGIGFALTGFYDCKGGILVTHSVLEHWRNVPIKYLLEESFDIPVFINDSIKAHILAEQWYGNGLGIANFVTLRVRTMASLGIVINSSLYTGHGNAGIVNNLFVLPIDAACTQGQARTLQELGSGRAILEQIRQKANVQSSPLLWEEISGDMSNLSLISVVKAAERNDPLCISVLCETARYWARAIARISEMMHPQKVIISGVFAGLESVLAPPINKTLQESIFPSLRGQIPVEFSKIGSLAGAKGAAAMVLQHSIEVA